MPEIANLILILLIGFAAGFVDSTGGPGGLITVPSLMLLGLPPQVAIATDRIGVIGQIFAAAFKFWGKIVWKYVPVLTFISLVGSIVGSNILLNLDPKLLQRIISVLIIGFLPVLFLKSKIGVEHTKVSRLKTGIGLFLYLILEIYAGFFGAGMSPLMFYTLTYFFGFTMIEVLATGVIPVMVLAISSLAIFALNGIVDYKYGIVLLIGMSAGGYLGAHFALKKGNVWLKHLLILFVIISAIKLLFF